MAVFVTLDSDNKVTNIIESETSLDASWVAVPDGQAPTIGSPWDASAQTFGDPADPQLEKWENKRMAEEFLQQSDWTQLPDNGLTDANKALWVSYRASLRTIARSPTQGALTWPEPPATEYS